MGEPRKPAKVFISYAHEDETLKDELLSHLASLRRQGVIAPWHDGDIRVGGEWDAEIRAHLDAAEVILLLVSADFIASDFCHELEMKHALERHKRGEARVVPVFVRPCDWKDAPFAKLQVLPKNGKPVTTWKRRDDAWLDVVTGVREGLEGLAATPTGRDPARYRRAVAPAGSTPHQLRSPPADFTGREEELAALRARLGKGGAAIVGLTGQGGVGKTALALRLAQELREQYPDAQIDIDLRGAGDEPLDPGQVMAEVIHAFEPERKLPNDLEGRGRVYRSVIDGKRALLLFDNARDRAQVEPLLPPSGSLLLVTSRQHFTLPGLYTRRLDTLKDTDAVALVRSIARRLHETAAAELAEVCGYLPLALRAAASVLAERVDLKPAKYLERLRGTERVKLVEEVLESSLELLDEPLRAFWLRIGVMPADFDASAAAAVADVSVESAEEWLSELVRRSLLDWEAAAERYRMHDLARSYARSRVDTKELYAAEKRHTEHFFEVARAADELYRNGGAAVMAALQAFDGDWTHIAAAQAWAAAHSESDGAAAKICCNLPLLASNILVLRQAPDEQVAWLEAALRVAQRISKQAATGTLLGNLGIAYLKLGEAKKSIRLFETHLAIAREFGDRYGEAAALGNLGNAFGHLNDALKSLGFYEQALALARQLGDRRGEGTSLGNMGNAHTQMGDWSRASTFYKMHIAIAREIGDHQGEGLAHKNLGVAHLTLRRFQKAITCFQRALAVAHQIADRHGECGALEGLGAVYAEMGDHRKSIECYGRLLVLLRKMGDRKGEATISSRLGLAYFELDDLPHAVDAMQTAIDIKRELGHLDLAEHEALLAKLRAFLEG
jgi:tetratricopeptide (TPR) repeat protein